jgi:hypothetical protein
MNYKHGLHSRAAVKASQEARSQIRAAEDMLILIGVIPPKRTVGRHPLGYTPLRSMADVEAYMALKWRN